MTLIGHKAQLIVPPVDPKRGGDPLLFDVDIVDERSVFGRTDYLITPVLGTGTMWVQRQRLAIITTDG